MIYTKKSSGIEPGSLAPDLIFKSYDRPDLSCAFWRKQRGDHVWYGGYLQRAYTKGGEQKKTRMTFSQYDLRPLLRMLARALDGCERSASMDHKKRISYSEESGGKANK